MDYAIEITNNFRREYPRAIRKARSEKIRVVRLRAGLYYVARIAPGHGEYLVRFSHRGDRLWAVCKTIYNEGCKGCWQERCCAHIAAAVERGIKYGKAKQRKEAA